MWLSQEFIEVSGCWISIQDTIYKVWLLNTVNVNFF